MIHILQVLCGPKRHAIYGIQYDDESISPQDVTEGVEALIEMWIAHGMIRRRCEVCDKPVKQFVYEDSITKEQDWDKAKAISQQLEAKQIQARVKIVAARKARNN